MKLFSILDTKAGYYNMPFSEANTVQAIRGFEVGVNDKDTIYRRFPADFALMELGSFDVNTGRLTIHDAPINLGLGSSFVRETPNQNSLPGMR